MYDSADDDAKIKDETYLPKFSLKKCDAILDATRGGNLSI